MALVFCLEEGVAITKLGTAAMGAPFSERAFVMARV